jgi:flagellar biosynthesis/type III secretory pathway chaperone
MSYQRLLKTMTILERLYTQLHEVSQHKRDALVGFQLPEVDRAVERENELIARIRRVHELRETEMKAIAPGANLTLGMLAEQAGDSPDGEALTQVRTRMIGVATELARTNRLNAQLCKQGLEHVHGFLELITRGSSEQNTYGNKGYAKPFASRALVNQSV